MTNEQLMVEQFHRAFGVTINYYPTVPSQHDIDLRRNLIDEEAAEFREAKTLTEVKDALGDLLYVVYGAAICYGIDLEPIFEEIHRSNMTKLWTDEEVKSLPIFCVVFSSLPSGERRHVVKRNDGKVIKSPSYTPANLATVLHEQSAEYQATLPTVEKIQQIYRSEEVAEDIRSGYVNTEG